MSRTRLYVTWVRLTVTVFAALSWNHHREVAYVLAGVVAGWIVGEAICNAQHGVERRRT